MNLFLYLSHISLGTTLKKFKSGEFRRKMNGMEGGGSHLVTISVPTFCFGTTFSPKFEKGVRVRKEMNYRFWS